MSFYKLIESGSGRVINTFSSSNDETGSISASISPYYYIELIPSGSTYIVSSSMDYTKSVSTTGLFEGTISGKLTGLMNATGSLISNVHNIIYHPKLTTNYVQFDIKYSTNTDINSYYYDENNKTDRLFRKNSGDWDSDTNSITMPVLMFEYNYTSPTPSNPSYRDIMYNILKYNLLGTVIRIEKKDSSDIYKEFRIDDIYLYLRMGNPSSPSYRISSPGWGFSQLQGLLTEDINTPEADLMGGYISYPGFDNYEDTARFDNLPNGLNGYIDYAYFEMQVTKIDSSAIGPSNLDDCVVIFNIDDIKINGYRREIQIYENSRSDWKVPGWVNTLTVHCIGAGGGGGGGAAGVKHLYTANDTGDLAWFLSGTASPADIGKELMFYRGLGYPNKYNRLGHEIVFGGGGGAGGNIATSKFDAKLLKGTYNIIVGAAGSGAKGISYQYHTTNKYNINGIAKPQATHNDVQYPIEKNGFRKQLFWDSDVNHKYFTAGGAPRLTFFENTLPQVTNFRDENTEDGNQTVLTYPSNPAYETGYPDNIVNDRHKYDGRNGGDSSFTGKDVNNEIIAVSAAGGLGGQTGTALRAIYNIFHYACDAPHRHSIPIGYTYGGGTRMGNTRGDYILFGGPGGYGISIAPWQQDPMTRQTILQDRIKLPNNTYENIKTYKNTAPSLPWGSKYNPNYPWIDKDLMMNEPPNPKISDLKIPYGSFDANFNEYGLKGYGKESSLLPSEFGPTGGGGGTGKQFAASTSSIQNIPKFPGGSNWSTSRISLLDEYTTLGKGGQNNRKHYLDNIKTIPFGSGGDGGYDSFLHPELNSLPQSGSKYGGGGGGGAGVYADSYDTFVYGQDGADGGQGSVILVLEGDAEFDILNYYPPQ